MRYRRNKKQIEEPNDEIKCYCLDVNSDSLFNGMDPIIEKMEISTDILKKYNCIGFNPDEIHGIMHCMFLSVEDRYMAYNEMIAAEIECKMNPLTAFVKKSDLRNKPLP